jgi:phosphatidylglycerophosphate synthase
MSNQLKAPWFYLAQWIGYLRLTLIISAFLSFSRAPYLSVLFVAVAEFLDMADGYLARLLNEETAFGRVLDLLLDRLAVIFACSALIALAPRYFGLFSAILALDLLGHMAMLYSAMLSKPINSHKNVFIGQHMLLDWYYGKGKQKVVMVMSIVCYDLTLGLGILYLISPSDFLLIGLKGVACLGLFKVYIHALHLFYSFKLVMNVKSFEEKQDID